MNAGPSPAPTQETFAWDCANSANGATDSMRRSCSDYASSPEDCGDYDDDDFSSEAMCCACNAPTPSPSTVAPTVQCFDTDAGATDGGYSNDCSWEYYSMSWSGGFYCGYFDDDDFSSEDMCCGCGGGTNEEPVPVVLDVALTVEMDCDDCELIASSCARARAPWGLRVDWWGEGERDHGGDFLTLRGARARAPILRRRC